MIEPTVGRAVWYRAPGSHASAQPQVAHIAFVHHSGLINASIIGHDGVAYPGTEIPLVQPGEPAPADAHRGHCEWMPFQIGQAQKTEAADGALQKRVTELEAAVDGKFQQLGDWLNPRLSELELKVSGSTTAPKDPPPAAVPGADVSGAGQQASA